MLDYASDPAAAFALLVPNAVFFSGVLIGYTIRDPKIFDEEERRPIWEVTLAPELALGLLFSNTCLGLASYIASDYDYTLSYVSYGMMLMMFLALNPLSQRAPLKWALMDAGLATLFSLTTSFMFYRLNKTAFYLSLPHLLFMSAASYGCYCVYKTSLAFKE